MKESQDACNAAPEKVKRKWRANPLPNGQYLYECFRYDSETGKLFWKDRPLSHFKDDHFRKVWRSRRLGSEAGSYKLTKAGDPAHVYVRVGKGERHMAHRIIWVMFVGDIPSNMQVDHRDRNPFNNRMDNLRLVTCAQNQWNRKPCRKKSSLPMGVHSEYGKYGASIQHLGKAIRLGTFDSPDEASRAYQEMAAKLRPGFFRA